jgi:adenosine deaminase
MKTLPKAELHAHLNGCIPPATIRTLIARHGVPVPDGFNLDTDLQVTTPVKTMLDYFKPWFAFKRLPVGKVCLIEMVNAAIQSQARDGVAYAELRNSPFNISEINGVSLEESLEWLVEAVDSSSQTHGIDARIIISFSRYKFDLSRARNLLNAIKTVNASRRIVGLDLSGDEDQAIVGDVAPLFREAKENLGLGITIHAGENGVKENVTWAIEECHADRIGHGLAAASDPKLLDRLKETDACVEVCLTSNLITGKVADLTDHPIHAFLAHGVPFVLCSDNPEVHNVSLSQEYTAFVSATNRQDLIEAMLERQMHYSFSHK